MAGTPQPGPWIPSPRIKALCETYINYCHVNGFTPLECLQAALMAAVSISAIPDVQRTLPK